MRREARREVRKLIRRIVRSMRDHKCHRRMRHAITKALWSS